jgi:acyl-CoA thioesterase FadM
MAIGCCESQAQPHLSLNTPSSDDTDRCSTASSAGSYACGEGVRPGHIGQTSQKQEPNCNLGSPRFAYVSENGIPPTQAINATWVVRSHKIEYLSPAFAGDEIEVFTWVVNIRWVRSLRRYEFIRKADGRLLVKGETEWVFVDATSGRPRAIPEDMRKIFQIRPNQNWSD